MNEGLIIMADNDNAHCANQTPLRTREEQRAKSLKHYHSVGKAQRQMRKKAEQELDVAVQEETGNDGDTSDSVMCDSDMSWLEGSESGSDGDSSGEWCDSDASVEGGLLSVDKTFLEGYQSIYWVHDKNDTVDYRIRCLHENLELWLGCWGGVRNWPRIAANPIRVVQIKAQMELGIQYAMLMRQVWGASVRRDTVEFREIEMHWEVTAKMMTKLYEALSILGSHMDLKDHMVSFGRHALYSRYSVTSIEHMLPQLQAIQKTGEFSQV